MSEFLVFVCRDKCAVDLSRSVCDTPFAPQTAGGARGFGLLGRDGGRGCRKVVMYRHVRVTYVVDGLWAPGLGTNAVLE